MPIPFFYIEQFDFSQKEIELNEDTSKHIVQVLRMQESEKLNLTDGKGNLITCEIINTHKRHCKVEVRQTRNPAPATRNITIAISLLKNTYRFEWLLEKTTEIGITEIIPLLCERTEKEKFRYERMNSILISAMLQSQQCWIPKLHEPQDFNYAIRHSNHQQQFIAHCAEGKKLQLKNQITGKSVIILIGPEGDFTKEEIHAALENNFIPVSLGETRLRSETAGIVAAALLQNI
ncbi:MAG: 16S rRNA (uracil(1498)-N(3))-methyltransferase [Bacteroidetes bacterium]|nr:16S rRNA (uracil(1498)-N(3))-methyltransferase [Bacteroidota bacterium]MBS1931378.1 16S rRNA (uracil(1498)-N(3))-methyltransferase [Bacteroidota bacterium]